MIVILEGADGMGKSTTINQLANDLKLPTFQSGGPKTAQNMYMMLDTLEQMAESDQIYLCDRVPFVSELVYSAAMDRKPVISQNILQDYWLMPIKIIYCKIDQEQALKNMSREFKAHKPAEHTAEVEKRHERIVDIYDELMDQAEQAGIDVFEYNWQDPTHYKQLKEWIYE